MDIFDKQIGHSPNVLTLIFLLTHFLASFQYKNWKLAIENLSFFFVFALMIHLTILQLKSQNYLSFLFSSVSTQKNPDHPPPTSLGRPMPYIWYHWIVALTSEIYEYYEVWWPKSWTGFGFRIQSWLLIFLFTPCFIAPPWIFDMCSLPQSWIC